MRYALIMAGGSGTRLWPMSTRHRPKQLLPLLQGKSLLEAAIERLDGLVEPHRRFIATSRDLLQPIARALPDFDPQRIIGEPARRDTLNAVGLAAAVIGRLDPQAVILVLTADQVLEPVDLFQQRVDLAFQLAERQPQTLVTFGIRPTEPSTAFGYVHLGRPIDGLPGAYHVQQFKEKPDLDTARQYVQSGQYLWNGGMFVWRADTLLEDIARLHPQAHRHLMQIRQAWDGPDRQAVLDDLYPQLPKISVDYAIMEPVSRLGRVATVELPVQWLDLGNWTTFAKVCPADPHGNAVSAQHALLRQTRNCIVVSDQPDHLVATIGLEDMIVIHTAHATLVCRKSDEQAIKQLQADLSDKYGDRFS